MPLVEYNAAPLTRDSGRDAQVLPPYPIAVLDPNKHETGPSRVIPFDLSEQFGALLRLVSTPTKPRPSHTGLGLPRRVKLAVLLLVSAILALCDEAVLMLPCRFICTGADSEATAPNLLCGFLHIEPSQTLWTEFVATSQAFFVIRYNINCFITGCLQLVSCCGCFPDASAASITHSQSQTK